MSRQYNKTQKNARRLARIRRERDAINEKIAASKKK